MKVTDTWYQVENARRERRQAARRAVLLGVAALLAVAAPVILSLWLLIVPAMLVVLAYLYLDEAHWLAVDRIPALQATAIEAYERSLEEPDPEKPTAASYVVRVRLDSAHMSIVPTYSRGGIIPWDSQRGTNVIRMIRSIEKED